MKKIIVFFLLICDVGCKEKTIDLKNNIYFTLQRDISYGNNSAQKMDLYIPKNKKVAKGIFITIHGGGWKAGDKSNLTFFTLSMMEEFPDYAFANINYRLAENNSFILPNQTSDIDAAIDYIIKNSPEINKEPKIILLGNSAGAHLSMLYGYNTLFSSKHSTKVKMIVNIVGPSDLQDPNFKNYADYAFVEKHMLDSSKPTPTDVTDRDIPNPVYWINENSPATISFYGNNDQVIPLSQKKILDSVLTKNKVYNESYVFSGGHLDWDNEKNAYFLIKSIDKFLRDHVEK